MHRRGVLRPSTTLPSSLRATLRLPCLRDTPSTSTTLLSLRRVAPTLRRQTIPSHSPPHHRQVVRRTASRLPRHPIPLRSRREERTMGTTRTPTTRRPRSSIVTTSTLQNPQKFFTRNDPIRNSTSTPTRASLALLIPPPCPRSLRKTLAKHPERIGDITCSINPIPTTFSSVFLEPMTSTRPLR